MLLFVLQVEDTVYGVFDNYFKAMDYVQEHGLQNANYDILSYLLNNEPLD